MAARQREPGDWARDLSVARPTEEAVATALRESPLVRRVKDDTRGMGIDFEVDFGHSIAWVELKEKRSTLSEEFCAAWPEVPPGELFILDELALRKLLWNDGMGYVVVHDVPERRWLVFGPWELALGPRRRFQRPGDRGKGEFLKGKLLLDLRAAAACTNTFDVTALFEVVLRTHSALDQPGSVHVATDGVLPVIPARRRPEAATGDQHPPPVPTPPPLVGMDLEADPVWCGLSKSFSGQLESQWGWEAPTPVQRSAFPHVIAGHDVLVLAPTAGGKTEAALLPLLDLWNRHGWRAARPSLLTISPLRALLDDQLERWNRAGALVGARAFAWHSDVSASERNAFKLDPVDAMLTTPESLENLLTSPAHDARRLLSGIQAVVIDEVHAFVATPRGAQLASLLERLNDFLPRGRDLQRIGLSATVADPDSVLQWLRGSSYREYAVVTGGSPVQGEDVTIRSYADLPAAIARIDEASADARSIVFTRSRRRAEELGHGLDVPVHHSSISATGRSSALDDLAEHRVDKVVATASLEMGIDIADLDLVVHDGAPTSPSSYLQRLGRAGRRTGHRRLVFTLGNPDDLVLTLAVLTRARRGDLDALPPQRGARLVLGQQAVAHTLQHFVTDRNALRETLCYGATFRGLEDDIDVTLDHLIADGWLIQDSERLIGGPRTQSHFGGPAGITRLLATFAVSESAVVETVDGTAVGTVDWEHLTDPRTSERGLLLSGQAWKIVSIDRKAGRVVVTSSAQGSPPSWRGPALDVSRATWAAVREVLAGTETPVAMDERARAWLEQQRISWRAALTSPLEAGDGSTVVHNFGGAGVNRAVLNALGFDGTAGGPSIEIHADAEAVRQRATVLLSDVDAIVDAEAALHAERMPVRHRELLPAAVIEAEAREFHVDRPGIVRCLELMTAAPWPS